MQRAEISAGMEALIDQQRQLDRQITVQGERDAIAANQHKELSVLFAEDAASRIEVDAGRERYLVL